MEREKLQRILLHLIRTKQSFCFDTDGHLYSPEEVISKLTGEEVTFDEALLIISK